ncbi:MAG TPA: thrombospondin type 3 repeat-containing protein [Methylomirabilota bacterium]|nr:thrombospondin type 3 repeat-containing protein [Methylomirabilota bacterium]
MAGPRLRAAGSALLAWAVGLSADAQPFHLDDPVPAIERWMYAFNAAPCDRPAGSVFGTFGDESGVDTRHGQHLIGWDTGAAIPPGQGAHRYLIRRCRVTLTINRGNLFVHDPTHDDFRTYFAPHEPGWQPDDDAGRPVELFGAGYRNGFTAASFEPCSPFGSNAAGERNAFAAGWSTEGRLVDVSNNVGKTNEAFPRFEAVPFAVGRALLVEPGARVPAGAKVEFDLNLADPLVLAYVQQALHEGRIRFMISSLHGNAGPQGAPAFPDFATQFNQAVLDPTRLELEGRLVRETDADGDGLPDDWELFYLAGLGHGAADDPDGDGASHATEYQAGTDPTIAASAPRVRLRGRAAVEVHIEFTHAALRRHTIEYADDLGHWQPLPGRPRFHVGSATAWWTDATPGASRRFYRLRMETP